MWLAYLIWIPENEKKLFLNNYQALSLVMTLAYFFGVLFLPVHSGILRRHFLRELEKIIIMNAFILGVLLSYLFVVKITYIYSRMVFGLFFLFDITLMTITHAIWKKILIKKYSAYANQSKIMVVTYRRFLEDFLKLVNSNNHGCQRRYQTFVQTRHRHSTTIRKNSCSFRCGSFNRGYLQGSAHRFFDRCVCIFFPCGKKSHHSGRGCHLPESAKAF